jgi:hypothetical protein
LNFSYIVFAIEKAKNEPDFYETPNTGSSSLNYNSKMDLNEDDSSNTHHINLKDAHDKYNKSSLNSNYADFSDTITNRRKFGYVVEPDTYEWVKFFLIYSSFSL